MNKRVLVVDDEKLIVKGIKFSLEHDGMLVDVAYDGEEALNLIQENTYDIVLLDVMLPKLSGYEVCQQVREFSMVPIIMVTAKSDDIDKILGLEYGADDYITKPFNILEVKARIKAILRRSVQQEVSAGNPRQYVYPGFLLECESRRLYIDEKEVRLTTKEYDVLELLASHPNKIYTRESLMNIIWGYDFVGDPRTVDVHIRRLREKIEKDPGAPLYVQTKWGAGYYFNDNE